jgi:P-type Ca2+ transporter type 2C
LIEVWRDGRVVVIPAVEIVSGAFIEHEAGDLAPTDARLLEASSLKSVEAELTDIRILVRFGHLLTGMFRI